MKFFSIITKVATATIISLFVFSIFGTLVYAQTTVICTDGKAGDNSSKYCSLTTIPGAFDLKTAVDPVKVIKNIYGISIGIGAMLAIVMIIWAGIEYATTEAITGKSDAKEKWQGAVFGLVLLLASYIILRTINVDLVNINLDLEKPIECTPTKGADGKDIPCGASADSLSKIVQAALDSAKITQQAEKSLTDTQKSVSDLKAKRAELAKKTAGMNMTTEEGRKISAELLAFDKQIMDTEQQEKTIIIDLDVKKFNQRTMNALSATNNALSRGDLNEVQTLIQSSRSLMLQDIETLKKVGASSDIIDSARKNMSATNALLNKTVEAVNLIKTQPSHVGDEYYFSKDTIEKRDALIQNFSTTLGTIARQNPGSVSVYQASIDSIKQGMDKGLATALHCTKGINIEPNKITCTK